MHLHIVHINDGQSDRSNHKVMLVKQFENGRRYISYNSERLLLSVLSGMLGDHADHTVTCSMIDDDMFDADLRNSNPAPLFRNGGPDDPILIP